MVTYIHDLPERESLDGNVLWVRVPQPVALIGETGVGIGNHVYA